MTAPHGDISHGVRIFSRRRRHKNTCPPRRVLRCGARSRFEMIGAIILALLVTPSACKPATRETVPLVAPDAAVIRPARVLVASDASRVRARAGRFVGFNNGQPHPVEVDAGGDGAIISASEAGLLINGRPINAARLEAIADGSGAVSLEVADGEDWSALRSFKGSFIITARDQAAVDVINVVDVEPYVASVVAGEVWPTFSDDMLRVQAIVARTFVLFQMQSRAAQDFDVTATQSSQVYRGIRDDDIGRRAANAASDTRGIICAVPVGDRPKLFCAYYSAACGGSSQSAAIFGPEGDIPPLAGGVMCDFCKDAPGDQYRWGPVRFTKQEVLSRLSARYSDFSALGDIQNIEISQSAPDGRAIRYRLIGQNGATREILAERMRQALGSSQIKSTHCHVRVAGDDVIFANGRGFGHGLGLCQWGAQFQTLSGRRPQEVIQYYYPGATLLRAY